MTLDELQIEVQGYEQTGKYLGEVEQEEEREKREEKISEL